MDKPKLLYIYPKSASFIKTDIEFLTKKFNVKTQDLPWISQKKIVFNVVRQFFFLLKNIKSSKAIVVSFAGYFSVLPVLFAKVFNKKSIIILNGTECVAFPRYNYGSLRKKLMRKAIELTLKEATVLSPVNSSLVTQIHTFDEDVVFKNQGIKNFFPIIATKTKVIPNGFNTNFWNFNTADKKPKSFITVVVANKKETLTFKGVDLFIEASKRFQSSTFTIVGLSDELVLDLPQNVKRYSFVKKEELLALYKTHQFYVQLSVNEGFGCALAEAMLCGCIPVVSNTGALPEVAGANAIVVKKRSLSSFEAVINKALNINKTRLNIMFDKSRNHIVQNFDILIREQLLFDEIFN